MYKEKNLATILVTIRRSDDDIDKCVDALNAIIVEALGKHELITLQSTDQCTREKQTNRKAESRWPSKPRIDYTKKVAFTPLGISSMRIH